MDKFRIFAYHRIGIPRDGRYESLTVTPRRFYGQLGALRRLRYEFAALDTVRAWLDKSGNRLRRPVALSFDDGYQDLFEHAFPFLKKQRIPATVFLVARRDTNRWVRREGVRPLELLSWSQVKTMADAGIDFGSHSLTHPWLTDCSDAGLREEVADSKKIIEDHIGRQVRHFCYPYGRYDQRVEEAVRNAGYESACTTQKGVVMHGENPWRLPRLSIGKRMGLYRFLARVMFRH